MSLKGTFFEILVEGLLCFRFRNRIGIDVAVEGLRLFYEHKKAPNRELLDYVRLCRVERIMMPYIEVVQCKTPVAG